MTPCNAIHPKSEDACDQKIGHVGAHMTHGGLIWDDSVNHPKHYTNHPSGIECIDVVRHMNFNRGNAVKYVWRAGEKSPAVEDLRKAIWYLQDEIKRLENGGT